MTENYINPFPPMGQRRLWSKDYIQNRLKALDQELKWESLGKLISVNIDNLASFSGIYAFVHNSAISKVSPLELHNEILYIGKSVSIKKRLKEYMDDRKLIRKLHGHKKNIRDNVRILFTEFNEDFEVFCVKIPPDNIGTVEDILIQLIDPILNSGQRLVEAHFEDFENSLEANLKDKETAFGDVEISSSEDPSTAINNSGFDSSIGPAKPAF